MHLDLDIDGFLKLSIEERQIICKRQDYDLIHYGPLAPKELAALLQKAPHRLYKCGDDSLADNNMHRHEWIAAMHEQGNLKPLLFVNALFGLMCFRRPAGLTSFLEINRQITAVLKEVTEAVQAVLRSIDLESEDGYQIAPHELGEIEKEIDEGLTALAALKEAAKMVHRKTRANP